MPGAPNKGPESTAEVFPTENLQSLGVPRATMLREGENLQVADLQERRRGF